MKPYVFKKDYSNDYMRWTEIHLEIQKIKNKNESLIKLKKVQQNIIESQDVALAYYFACDIGYENYKMQNIILQNKSPKYAILFAQNIKNADVASLQNLIFEAKEIKYICEYICSVGSFAKDLDRKKTEHMILEKEYAKYAHMLIKFVKGTNPHKFKDLILKSKKPRYPYELAKHLKSKKDLNLIQDLIIESGSFTYMRLFAEKIKSSNIEKIEQAILESNNVEEIKKFATFVKKSTMRNFVVMI